MKMSSIFEILNTEGPKIQYLYLWHWQNHTQPGSSALRAEVLFLHCLDWEQEIRGLQIRLGCIPFTRQWSAPSPSPSPSLIMRLDVAIPRGKQRHALCSKSKHSWALKKEMEAARSFRCHSPPCFPSSPWGVACLQGEGKSLSLVSACGDTSSGALPSPRWAQAPGCGPQALLRTMLVRASPCILLILALCCLSYAGTALSYYYMNQTSS